MKTTPSVPATLYQAARSAHVFRCNDELEPIRNSEWARGLEHSDNAAGMPRPSRVYFNEALMLVNWVAMVPPSVFTIVMIASAMPAAINFIAADGEGD